MRATHLERSTNETKIALDLALDGRGSININTGIGFFDHMLTQFARHGFIDMTLSVSGDLHVDFHHTIEDTGIALGKAINTILGGKERICRYGHVLLPMDETLTLCAIDFCGRPNLVFDVPFTAAKIGEVDSELFREFFKAFSDNAACALHLKTMAAGNNHHMAEGLFKALGKAVDQAVMIDERLTGAMTTKGLL
ncbi:MAG: imidazoleglycerol-phosphate dehydratase HisB [Clostridiales bacterium]|jgi:imidazoleglycerol-phosphate dehydratase|nr:imidazoleglycerol-phosphate dehydratase HisB [Clostridiales bacterium]